MGAGYGGLPEGSRVGDITAMEKNLSTLVKEKTLEDIKKIIDEESIEYNKLVEEREKLFDETDDFRSKIVGRDGGYLSGVTKEAKDRLSEFYERIDRVKHKLEKVQITAYQEIKERWNREIREKKV